jgi:hypothetical protein
MRGAVRRRNALAKVCGAHNPDVVSTLRRTKKTAANQWLRIARSDKFHVPGATESNVRLGVVP